MSLLGKMFGVGGKDKKMTTGEAIQKLRETEDMLIKKQDYLETRIEAELATAKKHGTKNKRAALQALKKKKRYEKQLQQIDGTLTTIELQREALESATTNTAVLQTMNEAAKALKAAHKDMDIDSVHDMMDEIAQQQDIATEISDAISNPVAFGHDIDEDELERELEELEQEQVDEELIAINSGPLPDIPTGDVPTKVPSRAAPARPSRAKVEDDDDDMKELEAWAS